MALSETGRTWQRYFLCTGKGNSLNRLHRECFVASLTSFLKISKFMGLKFQTQACKILSDYFLEVAEYYNIHFKLNLHEFKRIFTIQAFSFNAYSLVYNSDHTRGRMIHTGVKNLELIGKRRSDSLLNHLNYKVTIAAIYGDGNQMDRPSRLATAYFKIPFLLLKSFTAKKACLRKSVLYTIKF